jgi:hypothetical protein
MQHAPGALVHEGDFFTWAANTPERFECAAGNPPFIRYQIFKGGIRARALELCARHGANFTGLSSSWAPFLVAAASLLKPGGRMAFVVPAEIGHAPYSAPLLSYLVDNFVFVQVIAVDQKLFPDLSEDCWLLYAEGFGGKTTEIAFTIQKRFQYCATPPRPQTAVPVTDWRTLWKRRLRPFLCLATRATSTTRSHSARTAGDFHDEARAWRDWLLRATAGLPSHLTEEELDKIRRRIETYATQAADTVLEAVKEKAARPLIALAGWSS